MLNYDRELREKGKIGDRNYHQGKQMRRKNRCFLMLLGCSYQKREERNLKTNDTVILSLSYLFSSINLRVHWSLQ
jgi:hypothetical protein